MIAKTGVVVPRLPTARKTKAAAFTHIDSSDDDDYFQTDRSPRLVQRNKSLSKINESSESDAEYVEKRPPTPSAPHSSIQRKESVLIDSDDSSDEEDRKEETVTNSRTCFSEPSAGKRTIESSSSSSAGSLSDMFPSMNTTRTIRQLTKKRPKEDTESDSEYDISDDNDEYDDDESGQKNGKTKKALQHPNKKLKTPLRSLPLNTRSKRPLGSTASSNGGYKQKFKFLPNPNRIAKDYDAKSVICKKFKVPTMMSKPDKDGKTTPIQYETNSAFGEVKTLGLRKRQTPRALYDHTADDAIVLWDPDNQPIQEEIKITTDKPRKKGKSLAEILGLKKEERKLVHVVVDPALARVLRPHQVEGVKFLFNCTTGKVLPEAMGCIMADEMGLGKTLQCIALTWTLLQQSEELGKPTVQKAIITCPSSLVKNWANEFVKWLGPTRVQPLTVDVGSSKEKITAVKRWGASQGRNSILIISYESLRAYTKFLKKTAIGLLLCDEGHRLKNRDSKLFQELNSLNVSRRVILSGTPIQNDLSEYYALLDFANPGLLGTPSEFRRNYEIPILRGRDADATEKEREVSDEKVAEFWNIVSKFTIRRTNDILTKYLPVKYEHVVFCKLAPLQEALYNVFLNSSEIKTLLRGQGCQALKNITLLKKLCNHPNLLNLPEDLEGSESVLPKGYMNKGNKIDPSFSGKFMVLARMLAKIKRETKDKIVLISNYTQTLDLFEAYCKQSQYGVLRLDGSMNITKRQKLVDQFNDPEGSEFVFLLSSKAGGCGLNLIGANRLVLFDPDWNPAADQQALARVWRDGQKKDCFIYRFIAAGTIEEKIFQRQSHKQSLSNCVVDEADMERHFSVADMRRLFTLHTKSDSETHDTFKCKRCIQGKQHTAAEQMVYGDSSTWNHYDKDLLRIPDPVLMTEAHKGIVSYVFQYISHIK